eukprot:175570_1
MDILILLTLIGFLIISLCILLHSIQHFRCRFCVKYKYRMTSLPSYNATNSSQFNGLSRSARISATSKPRRSTNTNITPISMNNQHLRVSNSINMKHLQQTNSNTKPNRPHHRTNSSIYENRFSVSVSSIRTSFHSTLTNDPYKLIKREYQCCLYGVEEDFDFFPAAFLFYIIFICIQIMQHHLN